MDDSTTEDCDSTAKYEGMTRAAMASIAIPEKLSDRSGDLFSVRISQLRLF